MQKLSTHALVLTAMLMALPLACGISPQDGPVDSGPGATNDSGHTNTDGVQSDDAQKPNGPTTAPQWPQNGYAGSQNGQSPFTGPEQPHLRWDVPLVDAPGGGNVVIDGSGNAYLVGGEFVYAVSATGAELWRKSFPGLSSYLALLDSTTLVVGGEALRAIDTQTGAAKWEHQLAGSIETALVIAPDGAVQFGSHQEDSESAHYHVVNPDGSLRWSTKLSDSELIGSSALGVDGTIYVAGDKLRALAPADGRLVWEMDVEGLSPLFGPAVGPDGTIYLASNAAGPDKNESRLIAVTAEGQEKWHVRTGLLELTPAVGSDGAIYIHNYGGGDAQALDRGVYALEPDGSVRWKFDINCPDWSHNQNNGSDSSPTVDPQGTVYFGSECGTIFAVDKDGHEKWRFGIDGEFDNRPAISSDGALHICHAGGGPADWWRGSYRCYALADDGQKMPEPEALSRFAFCEQGCNGEAGSSEAACQLECLLFADQYCFIECLEVLEGTEQEYGQCIANCHSRVEVPEIPGPNNAPCLLSTEVGRTCDSAANCSEGDFIDGCCLLGVCGDTSPSDDD